MQAALRLNTTVLPGHRIEVVAPELPEGAQVELIVTFLNENGIDLRTAGIDETQAAELRGRLSIFTDWDDPEMDIYDHYDTAKSSL